MQPPAALVRAIRAAWGAPERILCNRFRLNELRDCVNGTHVLARVARWSEASEDIRALRKLSADGPLAVESGSRPLPTASLAAAMVANDDAGNVRLEKRGSNNQARDDVSAALVLAAGFLQRTLSRPTRRGFRHALAQ